MPELREGPAELLLVFGAAVTATGEPTPVLQRRLEGAVAAARTCRAPLFLVMGGAARGGPVEADVMAAALMRMGVPAGQIQRERESQDTLEQARRAARFIRRGPGFDRVLVCTSPFHQPRCARLLRLLATEPELPPMPADRPGMGRSRLARYVLREALATAWDVLLLRLLLLLGRTP